MALHARRTTGSSLVRAGMAGDGEPAFHPALFDSQRRSERTVAGGGKGSGTGLGFARLDCPPRNGYRVELDQISESRSAEAAGSGRGSGHAIRADSPPAEPVEIPLDPAGPFPGRLVLADCFPRSQHSLPGAARSKIARTRPGTPLPELPF